MKKCRHFILNFALFFISLSVKIQFVCFAFMIFSYGSELNICIRDLFIRIRIEYDILNMTGDFRKIQVAGADLCFFFKWKLKVVREHPAHIFWIQCCCRLWIINIPIYQYSNKHLIISHITYLYSRKICFYLPITKNPHFECFLFTLIFLTEIYNFL